MMSAGTYSPVYRAGGFAMRTDVEVHGATDAAALPLVLRWPERDDPKGCVVFCHGLGASGHDYAEISEHWARNGYIVIHPTFPDWVGAVVATEPELGVDPADDLDGWSGDARLRPRMFEILHSPRYWLDRIRIVGEVMDHLDTIVAATCGRLPGSVHTAIAGHSFGAYTSQLLAGAEIDLPDGTSRNFRDNRFSAAILLSAQGRDQQGLREGSWDGITGPMLNVTGTLDGGAKGQDWRWKVEPYEFAPPPDKYLALLVDADHYLGGLARPDQSPVPAQRDAVFQLTLAFLDAYVAGSALAKSWLAGVTDRLGDCRLQFRQK